MIKTVHLSSLGTVSNARSNLIVCVRLNVTLSGDFSQEREDLLSKFMAHGRAAEDSYSDPELRDVTVDFLLAGRDTTAVTLAWFMYEMCRHPEMVEKIYKEGIDVVGKKHWTDFESMAEHLTSDNLSRMHYLHAALSESLRLHPPLPRVTCSASSIDHSFLNAASIARPSFVRYSSISVYAHL
jgi:cytochrome P450